MRTTLNTTYTQIQTNLNRLTTDLGKINNQISSGLQMSTLSDEPVNLVSALRYRSSIAELDQYSENIQNGNTLITAADSALSQMKELTLRAKTLAIQATDPAYGSANREAIASEVKNLFEQAVDLANTQVNGKYIFGGFRTTGYNATEPTPFIIDKGDGYWVNGTAPAPLPAALTSGAIASAAAATTTDLVAGDLLLNGTDVGAVDLTTAPDIDGINMAGAENLKAAINAAPTSPAVTASLTTQISNPLSASLGAVGGEAIDFTLNGVRIAYTATAGGPAATAQETVDAINALSDQTGVTALLGDGTNGGLANAVILKNTLAGDESVITLTDLSNGPPDEEAITSLYNALSQGADAGHNTGQISLSSSAAISITTSSSDDDILDLIGLGGGGKGNYDVEEDGTLLYGYPLSSDTLKINGIAIPAPTGDGLSDLYADGSAAAKAIAINGKTTETGVTAVVVPAQVSASGAVSGGTAAERLSGIVTNNAVLAGNLEINGTVITSDIDPGVVTFGLNTEKAFNAQTVINQQSDVTGVNARLTTLYAGGAAVAGALQTIRFDLNNVPVSLTTGGISAAATAADIVAAINALSPQTGVKALIGNGSNGGVANSIVLQNVIRGDESDITLSNLDPGALALSGLAAGSYSSVNDPTHTHNTGEISLESDLPFTITSPTSAHDAYLTQLGLSSEDNTGDISYGSTPNLKRGDLTINGIGIITDAITDQDASNTLIDAINDKAPLTGVQATRGVDGTLQLAAMHGRNLHIETSAHGEAITHLTGGSRDLINFGSLQLRSDRKFILETVAPAINLGEPGLAALGLDGGGAVSGESGDVAGDGKIDVFSIHNQTGSVRYAGDRTNDLEIKIGKTTTMTVGDNGKAGIMDTDIFNVLKALENYLQGDSFTTVTGIHSATDTSVLLNSKTTGLEPESQLPTEDLFAKGSFTISVMDRDYDPPRQTAMTIGVDPAVDTLDAVRKRIDGIPHFSAGWTKDGQLKIESDNPARYTIELSADSSNFLKATGVSSEFMQSQGLMQSIADLDTVRENLTRKDSDFGARANRIDIQRQIYSTMSIITKENLSEVQDTDMIKAAMDLQAKQIAYQAALATAAKVMQLSLVDYLK